MSSSRSRRVTTTDDQPPRPSDTAEAEAVGAEEPKHATLEVDPSLVATSNALPAIDLELQDETTLPELAPRERTANLQPRVLPDNRKACFVVLAGSQEGAIHRLPIGRPITIGRADECDIRIDDPGVSRVHARVHVREDRVMVEDLGSRNGTFVRGKRVARQFLHPEDIVQVGATTVLKFSYIDDLEEQCRARLLAAALRDPLTGLFNRRHFDQSVAAECAASRRHHRPLSLVLLDVDDFKAVNDQYGHPAGDEVLREVARVLANCARREDQVFRYGGEEFAILARETDALGAEQFAERLRAKIARAKAREPAGRLLSVTASLGVASFEPSLQEDELVQRADAALYRAKRAGKDRVVVHPKAET